MAGKKSDDSFTAKQKHALNEATKNRKSRHEYMTLLMRDQENQEIGEERMLMLIEKLAEEKHFDDIPKTRADKAYRQKLYLKYHIPY